MLYGEGKYTYEVVEGWAKHPEGWEFQDILDLGIDSKDRVYVLSRGAHPLQIYDPDGNLLDTWDEVRGHGCTVGPDDCFYLARGPFNPADPHTVSKYSHEGKLLMTLGSGQPSDTGFRKIGTMDVSCRTIVRAGTPFCFPTGMAASASGNIYVSDGYGNCRIHKFSPDGKLLLSWGEPGYWPGQFRIPHGIWVDRQEQVYVADRENNRVQVFDAQGKFLSEWPGLLRPAKIFIDDEDVVYVAEYHARMSIFNTDGELLARWGSGWRGFENDEEQKARLFGLNHGVVVDSKGDLYVGDISWLNLKIDGKPVDRGPKILQKFIRRS
ncbi:peptidyl-alpha-hydroxyglycine alpha-amidating lyase family protein [Chloroflexota bacterium]